MKIRILIFAIFVVFNANAQNSDLKTDINWKGLTSFPEVEENAVIKQNLITEDKIQEDSSKNKIDDLSINLDFLNKSTDERIFYNFNANLRILNKYTDKVMIYKLIKDESINVKGYNVQIDSCAKVDIFGVENDFAFLEVSKNKNILFKGWISNINKSISYPELRDLHMTLDSCNMGTVVK